MKTLQEFRDSKKEMTKEEVNNTFGGISESENNLVYADALVIEILPSGEYYLLIERSDYISRDLKLLEQIAWDDFAKYELRLTPEEIENDLNIRK